MIQETTNESILFEINRLLEVELEAQTIYKLNEAQINAINEARLQYKNGHFCENEMQGVFGHSYVFRGDCSNTQFIQNVAIGGA